MNRQQKVLVVEELKKKFLDSDAAFLVGFSGLNVQKMHELRLELRPKGGSFKIAKARLMKIAVDGGDGVSELRPFIKDQIGLVFAKEGFSEVAKVLSDFSKKNKNLSLVAGYLDSQVFGKEKISQIALLPSREVLLSQLCGTLNAPIARMARALNMVILKPVLAIKQIGEKKK